MWQYKEEAEERREPHSEERAGMMSFRIMGRKLRGILSFVRCFTSTLHADEQARPDADRRRRRRRRSSSSAPPRSLARHTLPLCAHCGLSNADLELPALRRLAGP